jgi:hypothetical protein
MVTRVDAAQRRSTSAESTRRPQAQVARKYRGVAEGLHRGLVAGSLSASRTFNVGRARVGGLENVPPVKSTDRFSPRTKNKAMEATTSAMDSVPDTPRRQERKLRPCGKIPCLVTQAQPIDSLRALAPPDQRQQSPAAEDGGEHRGGDAEA